MKSLSSSANRQVILLLLAAGIAGFIFFLGQYRNAFPAASIDLKIPKDQVLEQARLWSERVGFKQEKLIKTIEFEDDNEAKIFLEYNLGAAAANELMRARIPVWYWSCRFCREFEREIVSVDLGTDGSLVRLDYDLANDKKIPDVSHEEARKIALAFISDKAGLSTGKLKPITDSQVAQAHRHDHSFVWEDESDEWKGARLRLSVGVSGNMVTNFTRYLHVPDAWERQYAGMRSYNHLLGNVAYALSFLFMAWTAYVFLKNCALHRVRWRFVLTIAGAMAAIAVAESINELPTALNAYEPTTSLTNFLISFYGDALLSGASAFIMMAVLIGAAEAEYRAAFGEHMALEWLLRPQGWRAPEFTTSVLLGYLLFGLGLGYQAAYYLLGKHFGYWCPLDVDNAQVLSGQIPALTAICTGIKASSMEELLFRVIGLTMAQRFCKNFWLANLVQAAIWGFGHSEYPQQPPFARGVELTLVGMLSGWVLKRFGLPALLIEHYLFDAFLESQPLFLAPGAIDKISALLAVLPVGLFGIACLVWRRVRGGAGQEPSLKNADLAVPQTLDVKSEEEEPAAAGAYVPLSAVARGILAAAIVVYFFCDAVPDERVGAGAQPLQIDREHAVAIASRFLADHHYDIAGYKITAQLSDGLWVEREDLQYVFEKDGLEKTRQLAAETTKPFLWTIRFFKPLDPEQLSVRLDGQGGIMSADLYRPEDGRGAKLSRNLAQSVAERFLRTMHPEYIPFNLADEHEEKLENRTDYHFEFEVPKLKVADAQYRVQESVIGDKPSEFGYYWDLPDKWRFEKSKEGHSTLNTITDLLTGVAGVVMGMAALWWVVGVVRGTPLRWRAAVLLGALVALLRVVDDVNSSPVAFTHYHTTTPWSNFLSMLAVSYAGGIFSTFISGTLLALLGLSAARLVLGGRPLLPQLKQVFCPDGLPGKQQQLSIWFDGILIGFGYICLTQCIGVFMRMVYCRFGHDVSIQTFSITCGVANAYSGGLQSLVDSASGTLSACLQLAIVIALYQKYCRGFSRFAVLILLGALLTLGRADNWQDGLISAASGIAYFSLMWFFISKLARGNLAAYIVYAWEIAVIDTIYALGNYALPLFTGDYFAALAVLAVPLVYLLYVQIGWRYAAKSAGAAGLSVPPAQA